MLFAWTVRVLLRAVAWSIAVSVPLLFFSWLWTNPGYSALQFPLLAASSWPGFFALLLLDRPWTRRPREQVLGWGRTLGRTWLEAGGKTYWPTPSQVELAEVPRMPGFRLPVLRAGLVAWALGTLPAVFLGGPLSSGFSGWVSSLFAQGVMYALAVFPLSVLVGAIVHALHWVSERGLQSTAAPPNVWWQRALGAAVASSTAGIVVASAMAMQWFSVPLAFAWQGVVLLAGLVAFLPVARVPPGPVQRSGRVFGRDWIEVADTIHWVSKKDAWERRLDRGAVEVEWGLSGFAMEVGSGLTPLPLVRAWGIGQLWSGGALLAFAVLPVLGMLALSLMVGNDPTVNAFWAAMALAVWVGLSLVPSLVWLGFGAVVRFALAALNRATTGSRVSVEGRVLRTRRGTFTLGGSNQEVSLTWGLLGAVLTLTNDEQRMKLVGSHADLAAVADALSRVEARGSTQDVPTALHALATAEHTR
ncbi:MAG: hypothetical protein H6737_11135 [Alphaproteobacteria bacterium]|nr:hypothetical protein [Alphaproteobacteria bacterium]